jgi:hypothetical protein
VLGREPYKQGCAFSQSPETTPGSDCYWFWALANGKIAVTDFIDALRASAESVQLNEPAGCLAQYATQASPHPVGDFIAESYRMILGRYPTATEIRLAIAGYAGGTTHSLLRGLVGTLVNGDEFQNMCLNVPPPPDPGDGGDVEIGGCTDPNAENYDPAATYNDGSCVESIGGCTDPNAENYDSAATYDDGSCVYSD